MNADEYEYLRKLLRRLARVIRKWNVVEEEVDSIRCYLEAFFLEHDAPRPRDWRHAEHDVLETLRQRGRQDETERAYAASGAGEIKISGLGGGSFEALIDGRHRIKLTPRLADLLNVLAGQDGVSTDGIVPWKSRPRLRHALATTPSGPISNHSLNHLVSRLRHELRAQAGLHRDFIMVHPEHGLRFALRQEPLAIARSS